MDYQEKLDRINAYLDKLPSRDNRYDSKTIENAKLSISCFHRAGEWFFPTTPEQMFYGAKKNSILIYLRSSDDNMKTVGELTIGADTVSYFIKHT